MIGRMEFFSWCAAAIVIATLSWPEGSSAAAPPSGSDHRQAFSLTISPARIVLPAGSNSATKVTAYNTGKSALDVHVVLTGFSQRPNGDVIFGGHSTQTNTGWIHTTPDAFHLAPGARQKVRLVVHVPETAEPGDHQVGIVFLVPGDASNGNLIVNRGIGTQLFIRAPGPVIRRIDPIRVNTPWLSTGGPIPIELSLTNKGTVHEDFFSPHDRIIAHTNQSQLLFPNLTVFAGVTRNVTTTWNDPPWFCHCNITVAVPNANGTTRLVRTEVWVIPLYRIVGAVLLIVGAYVLYRWRRQHSQAALDAARDKGFQEGIQTRNG
jgi:hypothetical protein